MSYSRRQLYALGEPLGECVTKKKLGGGYIAGGGGSSPAPAAAPSQQTITQSNIPEWAIKYASENLGKAQALTDTAQNPYQQYQGQRIADFNPMQQQAFSGIAGMQPSAQTGQATGLAGMSGLGGLAAGQNYFQQASDPAAMAKLMSSYQQNVTDFQKQQAIQDYSRQLPGMGAAAANAGAFGGSRQAIANSEGQRNLTNQLAGIQATGSQNAFQNAQQAQQFGSNLGLQGLQLAGQNASTLGNLGQNAYAQNMGINAAQQQAGAQQQAQTQQGLSQNYQDFLNQQNYPYKQLGFMSDIIRGTPSSAGASTMYQAPPSNMAQFGGAAQLGLGALMKYGPGSTPG